MTKPVLLITGGSRGIGAATAKLGAARCFDVAINYVQDEGAAKSVVAEVTAAGRRAIAIKGDMGREEDIERMFKTVDNELGTVTALVCNTGITGPASRVDAVTTETLRQVIDINLFGVLICLRAAVRRMSTKHGGEGGSIVMLSSAAATIGAANEYVWYAGTKGAIDSMTVGLAREVVAEKIRVNAVAPGLILTDIHPPGRVDRVLPALPMGRGGTTSEVAEAILFLLSDAASYITGTTLRVSGGR